MYLSLHTKQYLKTLIPLLPYIISKDKLLHDTCILTHFHIRTCSYIFPIFTHIPPFSFSPSLFFSPFVLFDFLFPLYFSEFLSISLLFFFQPFHFFTLLFSSLSRMVFPISIFECVCVLWTMFDWWSCEKLDILLRSRYEGLKGWRDRGLEGLGHQDVNSFIHVSTCRSSSYHLFTTFTKPGWYLYGNGYISAWIYHIYRFDSLRYPHGPIDVRSMFTRPFVLENSELGFIEHGVCQGRNRWWFEHGWERLFIYISVFKRNDQRVQCFSGPCSDVTSSFLPLSQYNKYGVW